MAKANHKARPAAHESRTALSLTLRSSADQLTHIDQPRMPWMEVVDAHLGILGFKSGERVCLSINHVTRQISISPDFG